MDYDLSFLSDALPREAEELRGNLAAETKKSARLQEELDVQAKREKRLL